MRELVGGSRTRACGYQRAVLDPAELANLALEERKPWRAVCSQPVLKHRPSAASSFARGQPSIIMDDTEEAQAWIDAWSGAGAGSPGACVGRGVGARGHAGSQA